MSKKYNLSKMWYLLLLIILVSANLLFNKNFLLLNQSINLKTNITETEFSTQKIAEKYEQHTYDLSIINYKNISEEIKKTNFQSSIETNMPIDFQIKYNNAYWFRLLFFKNQTGKKMKTAYEKNIKDNTIVQLKMIAIISIFNDIAHFYGDNKLKLDKHIRIAAISKSVSIITEMSKNLTLNYNIMNTYQNDEPSYNNSLNNAIFYWADKTNELTNFIGKKQYQNSDLTNGTFFIKNLNELKVNNALLKECDNITGTKQSIPENKGTIIYDSFYAGKFKIYIENIVFLKHEGLKWTYYYEEPSCFLQK